MPETNAAADISAQDLQEYGEPSNEGTVADLQALGQQALDVFKKERGESGSLVIDADLVLGLTSVVEREIPFFHQGSGVATLPRQIDYLTHLRPVLADPVSEKTRREIMRGLDCKLPTVVLGYALMAIAGANGGGDRVYLITQGRSNHPSLMVEADESVFKIDFQTRRDSSAPKLKGSQILPPAVFREKTKSFARVQKLTQESLASYRAAPYIRYDLEEKSLRELDINFINS